jgi:SpoVK/Ycf46/Vps4 family AAA+-type ATPase
MTFRALTLEPELLRGLLEASEYLDEEIVRRARSREPMVLFEDDDN